MAETIKHYWFLRWQDLELYDKTDAKLSTEDIIEMQKIDSDCNDCKHFKRGEMIKVPGLTYFKGHCLLHDKPTKAYPVQYSGHECFQHRKE